MAKLLNNQSKNFKSHYTD